MTFRPRWLAIGAVGLCIALSCVLLADTAPAIPRGANLDRDVHALISAGAPGVVVLVRNGAHVVRVARGLGNREPETLMRTTDRFRIGSLTKSFVATVVLQLVGEGVLSLDDSVERWVPGLVPNGKAISVRRLLNHTSGIFDYFRDEKFVPRLVDSPSYAWSPHELVNIATAHPPLFAPGAGWAYANTNYAAVGVVVEAAARRPLRALLEQRIIRPLNLGATAYPDSPNIEGPHAHAYLVLGKPPARDVTLVSPTAAGAAGGLVSTADDVAQFYRALLGGRLLRPDLLRAMQTTVATNKRLRYGLGLAALPMPCGTAWGHDGEFAGYLSFAVNSKDGARQVVVLVNSVLEGAGEQALEHLLAAGICGP